MQEPSIRGLLFSCASCLALSSAAFAQSGGAQSEGAQSERGAPDEIADEIVVSGFRSSIETSVAAKRNEQSIIEAVSAEEIGKLPDVSIAESLGRLPGLATQRTNGRASVLSIRGLGPDLSTALLNGREQVTTGDNRGVEFDQYPAELLSSAVVYKTPYAGLIGQGLAGTVDLRTIRPLDKSERVVSFNGRYEFNEDGSLNPDSPGDGFRATGTIIDQFADDTLGVAVGVSLQSTPTQIEAFNAWGYAENADGNLVIGGVNPDVTSNDLDRIGGFFTLEYKPNDNIHSTIDVFYSDFAEDQRLRGIEFPLGFGGGFGVGLDQLTVAEVEDGFVTRGAFDNVRGVVRNDVNVRRAELLSAGWNGRYQGEVWGVEADVSYSRADRRDELIESYSGTGYNFDGGVADTIAFTQPPGGLPTLSGALDYTDPDLFVLTDPLGWGAGNDLVQTGFINAPETVDELWHLRASVDRDIELPFISNIEVGVDYGMREKSRNIDQQFLTLAGGPLFLSDGAILEAPIPQEALLDETTGTAFLGVPGQVSYDALYLLNNGFYQPLNVELSSFSVAQDWTVNEDVLTGWVKFGVDEMIGSVPVTGNFGLQVVHTDQSSQGFRIPTEGVVSGMLGAAAEEVEDGDRYTNFLPSANLIFEFSDSLFLRFGASRTLARARLDLLNSSLSLNLDLQGFENELIPVFSANGGNARLRPTISNQVDLSLEKYFGGAGYVALAVFYKDLQDFVNENDDFFFDFSGFIESELTPEQAAMLPSSVGLISGPTNNGSGRIAGAEATVSLPLDLVAPALEGFGIITSGSFTDSEVTLTSRADPSFQEVITVPGLSRWVVNSTLYYERGGFETRISHRFRTDFLAEVTGISATRVFRTSESESIIDAQIGYEFQGGPLEGVRLSVQGLNLTDEPFITFQQGDRRQLIDEQAFGRTYLFGVSYAF